MTQTTKTVDLARKMPALIVACVLPQANYSCRTEDEVETMVKLCEPLDRTFLHRPMQVDLIIIIIIC